MAEKQSDSVGGLFSGVGKQVLLVFLAVLAWRLYSLLAFAASPFLVPESGDMAFYHDWAMRVLHGTWDEGKAFYGLPGYPFLLAGVYQVLGLNFLIVSFLQLILDAISGVFIFLLARLALGIGGRSASGAASGADAWAFRSALPWVGALGWAVFQPSVAFSLILMPTAWTLCLYWGAVYCLARWGGMLTPGRALGLGLVCGVASMVVATVLALVPLAAVASFASRSIRRDKLLALPLLVAGVLIGSSPCWMYNRFVAGEPVFLSAHSGLNLYVGNNPLATGYPRLPQELRATQAGMLADSIRVAERAAGRPLTHAEVSAWWSAKARTWMAENPGEWIGLLGRKLANFWNGFEYDDLSALTILRENGILLPGLVFAVFSLLGLPGLVIALWRGTFAARLVAGGVLAHLLVLLPVFITERYRLPAVPGLIVLSLCFLDFLVAAARGRRPARLAVGAALLAGGALFVFAPRDPALTQHDLYNSGRAALAAGQLDLAERKLEKAAVLTPRNAEIQFSLGNLRLEQGDRHAAKTQYRRTIELDPRHDRAWNNLGVLALEEGRLDVAEHFISRSLEHFPDDAKTHYILALIREKRGELPPALDAAREAARLAPRQPVFKELVKRLESATSDGEPAGSRQPETEPDTKP